MTENEEFIYESIFNQVRMGFLSIEEIKENIAEVVQDNGFDDEISEEWTTKLIEKEFELLTTESTKWEKPTDTEKLIQTFDKLCKMNIIALHNAGFTTSDGETEVVEVERALRAKGKKSEGYCFYHEQDLARAITPDNPSLMIAFQKVDNTDDETTIKIGNKVVEVLKKFGFEINWNSLATKKIEIVGFHWKKLYKDSSKDLLDYSNVVQLMLK